VRTSDLDYELPPDRVATEPVTPRDAARLMVVSRSDPDRVEHRRVSDLPDLLRPRDLMAFNVSSVVPARFYGRRLDTGGRVQGLYLRDGRESGTWVALLRARRFRPGARVRLLDPQGRETDIVLTMREPAGESDGAGAWIVGVESDGQEAPAAALARVGLTPLPPYILAARRRAGLDVPDPADRGWYQTVYADPGRAGSVAAPTAGLHFTPELLERLESARIERADVVLHVGPGTFKPIESDRLEDHDMHAERCALMPGTREAVESRVQQAGPGRILAVGTTTARTLESFAMVPSGAIPRDGWIEADLMIAPGHQWRWVHGLMTNFHLPRSTLLAMVASLLPGGVEQLKHLYALAIEAGYRFYSYGDAMLIEP